MACAMVHDGASAARPTNVASGKRYRGINTLALWTAGLVAEYGDGLWGTYKQWQEAGAQVRQGERSTTVVLWRETQSSRQPNDDDDDDGRRRMFARAFSVFNVAQVDGYQRPTADILSESQRLAHAEAFISNLGIRTEFEGSEAYYRPSADAVSMPPFASFRDPASFYGVSLPETVMPAVQSTGSTVISQAGSDLPPMPQKNAAWRFSADSSWLTWELPTIRAPTTQPILLHGSRS